MPRTNVVGTTAAAGSGARRCAQAGKRERRTDSTAVTAATIAAILSPPLMPVRAELSGSRRCSALGITIDAYAPVLTLARRLIRAGLPPDRILEVYRGATLCFRVPLAVAARLRVKDDKDGVPRFKNYVPFSAARVPAPVRQTGTALPRQPSDEKTAPPAERADEAMSSSHPRTSREPLQKTPSAGERAHG